MPSTFIIYPNFTMFFTCTAHLKYKQYRGPGKSSWTLEDVYMETSYVLSGLSRKAGLCLLSFPTQPPSSGDEMDARSNVKQQSTNEVVDSCSNSEEVISHKIETQNCEAKTDDSNGSSLGRTRESSENDIACCSNSKGFQEDTFDASLSRSCESAKENFGVYNTKETICESNTISQNNQSILNTDAEQLPRGVNDTKKEVNLPSMQDCTKPNENSDEDEYVCITDDETCPIDSSDSKWDTSNDLPLMANVDEVLVTHYVLNLEVSFDEKVMSGDITLFLKPATQCVLQRQFQLCLDCSLVHIESVEEINLRDDFSVKYYGTEQQCDCSSYPNDIFQVDKFKQIPVALPYTFLPYAVRNWCMRIWKPRKLGRSWPRCIRIKYRTRPEGKSLTWANDQDQRYSK